MLAIVRRKATESDLRRNCIRGRKIGAQSCEGCQLTFRRRLCQPSGAKVEVVPLLDGRSTHELPRLPGREVHPFLRGGALTRRLRSSLPLSGNRVQPVPSDSE